MPELHVVAGVLARPDGRVLIAQRTAGRELAGAWEFPGGKVAAGESARQALTRELDEELGIAVLEAQPLIDYRHRYPTRVVRLDVWTVSRYVGEPGSREGQSLLWEMPDRLLKVGLLAADRPIVAVLLGRRISTRSG